MNKDEIIIGCAGVILVALLFGAVFIISYWSSSVTCKQRYASFENKYSFWEGCMIKVKDKWIPNESYYFKEE